jgi:type II secretion system protein H
VKPAFHCRRDGAFTLIEMMIVMILIGILSAMILPQMKGTYADALLRSSGRDLVNVFKLAYSRSVSLNQTLVVRFNTQTGRYSVERETNRQDSGPSFVPLRDVTGASGKIDTRIKVEFRKNPDATSQAPGRDEEKQSIQASETQSASALTFYPDGTADSAEIILRDQAGFALKLRIDPVTARVEFLDPERE